MCCPAVPLESCRDRVQNLYFAYLFVLRAVMKAAPVLTSYQYDTGLAREDQRTQELITQLVSLQQRLTYCNVMRLCTVSFVGDTSLVCAGHGEQSSSTGACLVGLHLSSAA